MYNKKKQLTYKPVIKENKPVKIRVSVVENGKLQVREHPEYPTCLFLCFVRKYEQSLISEISVQLHMSYAAN